MGRVRGGALPPLVVLHSSTGPQRRLRRGGAAPPSGPLQARTSQFPEPRKASGGYSAGLQVGLPGAGPGRAGAGRRLARRAAAWARRAMAAPEPAPRRGREREREREDESEDESDILEESPCGRWQKRREQVGTGAGDAAVPKPKAGGHGALGVRAA